MRRALSPRAGPYALRCCPRIRVFFVIYLAGVPVPVDLVQQLARQVDRELGDKLRDAVTRRVEVVALQPDQ